MEDVNRTYVKYVGWESVGRVYLIQDTAVIEMALHLRIP